MFTSTKQILSRNKVKVVPAFNFGTADVARASVEVCEEKGQDVILQTSMNEAQFLGLEVAVGIVEGLSWSLDIAVSLHLDHAKDLGIIEDAIEAGYTSFLADVSSLGFEEGVEFVNKAKKIAGEDTVVEASLTNFERGKEFVEKTKPDLLASFSIVNGEDKTEIDKITHVRNFVKTPLVLHDGSSKSEEEIKEAVALGVVKINWNTCLRQAWTKGLRETLVLNPNEIKPYNILGPSVGAVREVVKEKVSLLP